MRKLLIVKTGSTLPDIKKTYGDFEDFFLRSMGIDNNQARVLSAYDSPEFPDKEGLSGVIVTGSHSMVTDYEEWSVKLAKWLRTFKNDKIPVLGVCYGHQLIADAFGGKVDYDHRGKEVGTVRIHLTGEGKQDALLGKLPEVFTAQSFHSQRVVELPENAVLLAGNPYETHHAYRIGEHIWGVQFHPEFGKDIMEAYIDGFRSQLEVEKNSIEELKSSLEENVYGRTLLRRFYELTLQ